MNTITTTIDVEFTPRARAVMDALSKALGPQSKVDEQPSKTEWPPVDMQEGERYAGVVLNSDGSFSHHLILSAFKPETDLNWKDAMALAEKMRLSLPTKQEAALLYANLQDQFDTDYWYWTSTQFSEFSAWGQYFDNGSQISRSKGYERRCRFVRRISTFIL